jgi:hypothetical protein
MPRARARTQAGDAVCAATLRLDIITIQAIPPAIILATSSGMKRR